MRPLLIFLLMGIELFAYANSPVFHRVPAKKGDGIYSILRRYQLLDDAGNIKKFIELNELSKDDKLIVNNEYILPVMIYSYDGKSIRTTIGNDDWDIAVGIKKYNEKLLEIGLRKTHYTASKILWVPIYYLNKEELPEPKAVTVSSTNSTTPKKEEKILFRRNFDIFGDKYADTPILDDDLQGSVFYIVTGHGGPDPGAMTKVNDHTLCEDEYAYDIGLRLTRKLLQHGAIAHVVVRDQNDGIRDEAYLECDRDEVSLDGKKIPLNQTNRLRQRSHDVNKLYKKYKKKGIKNQYCIVLHVDSRKENQRTDLYFYHHEKSASSKAMCKSIYDCFSNKYAKYRANGQYDGSISSRNLHMIRETNPPTVYIEMGNLKNSADQKRFLINSNRQAVADWIAEGILNH